MPLAYEYDPSAGLVVVTLSDRTPGYELTAAVRRLIAAPDLPPAAPVLVNAHALRTPLDDDQITGMARLVTELREWFGRRVAVVTSAVGMSTTAQLIVILAGPPDRFIASTSDEAARRWLLEPTG